MIEVFSDHAKRVQKRILSKLEPDDMLGPIDPVFRHSKSDIGPEPLSGMYKIPYICMAEKTLFLTQQQGPDVRMAGIHQSCVKRA